MTSLLLISVLVALLAVQVSCSKDISRRVSVRKADPAFHGYIVLAQFECDDFECPDWSLTVSRLATECFTFPCSNEEKIEIELVPKSPIADMDFPVFTAYDAATRLFYVAGVVNGISLWTVHIADNFTAFTLVSTTRLHLPTPGAVFTALEFNPVSGVPLALFQDGTVFSLLANGSSSYVGNVLNGNSTRVITQATSGQATGIS